jgi:UDP-glucose:(heptosyl)LPS alpha-1,3-glucosyltransferase
MKLAKHAQKIGVSSRISWLGHREDINHLMAAADLLVHPARYDTTGTVILEGIVNGLPVIASAACGYARHVLAAEAGNVLREPFEFPFFISALKRAQDASIRRDWSLAGAAYGADPTLYQGRQRAAKIIIEAAHSKSAGSVSSSQ